MKILAATLGALALLTTSMRAQQVEDIAAYRGIVNTTVGILTPLPPASGLTSWGVNVRASRLPRGDLNDQMRAFGGGIDFAVGRARFGTQVFLGLPECDKCDGGFGVGGDFDLPLWSSMVGGWVSDANIAVGLRPVAGFTKGSSDDETATSAGLGAPVSIAIGQSPRFVTYIIPGVAWGKIKGPGKVILGDRLLGGFEETGTSITVGGGVGVSLASGVGVSLGLTEVFVDKSEIIWGLAFTWHEIPVR